MVQEMLSRERFAKNWGSPAVGPLALNIKVSCFIYLSKKRPTHWSVCIKSVRQKNVTVPPEKRIWMWPRSAVNLQPVVTILATQLLLVQGQEGPDLLAVRRSEPENKERFLSFQILLATRFPHTGPSASFPSKLSSDDWSLAPKWAWQLITSNSSLSNTIKN